MSDRIAGTSRYVGWGARVAANLRRLDLDDAWNQVQNFGDLGSLRARLLRLGDTEESALDLCHTVGEIRETWGAFPGIALRETLRASAQQELAGLESVALREGGPECSTRWPSTIREIDARENGGFYGVTVLGGKAGAGKSMLAIASAVEAAQERGTRVVYFNAEMTTQQVLSRIWAASGGETRRVLCDRTRADMASNLLHVEHVNHTVTFADLVSFAIFAVEPEDERVLIVLDSVNTIVDFVGAQSGEDYFATMARIVGWAITARRRSEGAISFIIVSELNAKGEIKGLKLEYSGDFIVAMDPKEDGESVEVRVKKGREGGRGYLGVYECAWKRARFVKIAEA